MDGLVGRIGYDGEWLTETMNDGFKKRFKHFTIMYIARCEDHSKYESISITCCMTRISE